MKEAWNMATSGEKIASVLFLIGFFLMFFAYIIQSPSTMVVSLIIVASNAINVPWEVILDVDRK